MSLTHPPPPDPAEDVDRPPSRTFRILFGTAMVLIAIGYMWVLRIKTERVVVEQPPVLAVADARNGTVDDPRLAELIRARLDTIRSLTVITADSASATRAGAAQLLFVQLERDGDEYRLTMRRTALAGDSLLHVYRVRGTTEDDAVYRMAVQVAMSFGLPRPIAGQAMEEFVAGDSGTIRIIENDRPAVDGAGGWASVEAAPELEIGVVDGPVPYTFSRIDAVVEVANGEIVVADGSHEVRVFGPVGTHLRTFGGPGQGPGEFSGTLSIRLVPPDTLLTWDAALHRLTWFTLDGEFVKDQTLAGTAASRWEVLPDASVVGHREVSADGVGDGVAQEPKMLVIARAPSGAWRSIRDLPGHPAVRVGKVQVPGIFHPTIGFSNWAIRTSPPSIVVADDPDGHWTLSVYDLDGHLTSSIRSAIPRRPVTRELVQNAQRFMLAGIEGMPEAQRRNYQTAVQAIPLPDSTPAISAVFTDNGGRLWVQRWRGTWEEDVGIDTYDVIDRSGRWLGWVSVDRSLGRIVWIGDNHILFDWTGPLGVSRVRKHRVQWNQRLPRPTTE